MKRMTGMVVLGIVLVMACYGALAGEYLLYPWKAGIVVWPNTGTSIATDFVDRLGQALDDACKFWECEPPVSATDSEDSEYALKLTIPDAYEHPTVPPLRWEGKLIRPIVVFAFPDVQSMRNVLGIDESSDAFWVPSPILDALPHARWWIAIWGSTTENLLTSETADTVTLVHEFTHWLTYAWLRKEHIQSIGIPSYLIEGLAALASESVSQHSTPYDRPGVISWASHNCLKPELHGEISNSVGESLVSYLIDELGLQGFLESLREWSNLTYDAIHRYEPGWRESLGLPPQCHDE